MMPGAPPVQMTSSVPESAGRPTKRMPASADGGVIVNVSAVRSTWTVKACSLLFFENVTTDAQCADALHEQHGRLRQRAKKCRISANPCLHWAKLSCKSPYNVGVFKCPEAIADENIGNSR